MGRQKDSCPHIDYLNRFNGGGGVQFALLRFGSVSKSVGAVGIGNPVMVWVLESGRAANLCNSLPS